MPFPLFVSRWPWLRSRAEDVKVVRVIDENEIELIAGREEETVAIESDALFMVTRRYKRAR